MAVPQLDIDIDDAALRKALRIAPQELKRELGNEFDHIQRSFLSTFRKGRLQGPPGVYGDGQRGLFGTFKRASIHGGGRILDMGVEIFSESKVGKRHEYGLPLIPKGAHLLIPFRANDSAVRKMYTGGRRPKLKKQFKDPSRIKGLFEMPIKGETYLAKRYGPKVVLLYIKKSRAEYKDALGFYAEWAGFGPKAITYLNRAIHKALDRL